MTARPTYAHQRPIIERLDRTERRDAARRTTVAWLAPSLLLIAVGSLVGLLTVLGEVALGHRLGLDDMVHSGLELERGTTPRVVASILTWAGHVVIIVPFLVAAGWIAQSTRRLRPFVIALVAVAGAELTTQLVKRLVERPRPTVGSAYGFAFPSGHSTVAAVVWLTLAFLLADLVRSRRVRVAIFATAVAVMLAVAWSRVALGMHWFTDVAVGLTVGVLWAWLARLATRPAPDRSGEVRDRIEQANAAARRERLQRMRHQVQIPRVDAGAAHGPRSAHAGRRHHR